ncbi:hypothetical protein FD754_009329, partial [Muntiacus muntjak]
WCDIDLTTCFSTCRSYKELSNCTRHVAQNLDCFWPNAEVDKFFLAVHQHYFRNCPVSGRALQDPPSSVLCPFIVVPILVTLLVTVLVVWRSKRPEGIVLLEPQRQSRPPNPLFYREELTLGCQPEWSSIGVGLGRAAQLPGGSGRSCWSCWGQSELSPNNPHRTRFLPVARLWRHICD